MKLHGATKDKSRQWYKYLKKYFEFLLLFQPLHGVPLSCGILVFQ